MYDYRTAFNGFAAELSADQADTLAKQPGVLSVSRDELHQPDTSRTPGFLGLDAPGGAWEQLGGPGAGGAGDGVVVGINRFGLSAPGATVMKELGMTPENVVAAARKLTA